MYCRCLQLHLTILKTRSLGTVGSGLSYHLTAQWRFEGPQLLHHTVYTYVIKIFFCNFGHKVTTGNPQILWILRQIGTAVKQGLTCFIIFASFLWKDENCSLSRIIIYFGFDTALTWGLHHLKLDYSGTPCAYFFNWSRHENVAQ